MPLRLLFLQLPRLDPDVTSPGENVMSAAACLRAALERSPEGAHWTFIETPDAQDGDSDSALLDRITDLNPDVLSATCYLWNIERTLFFLRLLKKRMPTLRIAIGGPDIATNHPLLPPKKQDCTADALVIGEGETVFPSILSFFRTGQVPNFKNVSWRNQDGTWAIGTKSRQVQPLRDLLPAPDHPINHPNASGMAYLETSRGCPMHCAFCCYNIRRTTTSCLPPEDVEKRIRILRSRGTKEIRLTDPTFNANPRFDEIIDVMVRENADHGIAFFVEIRADTLTDDQAKRLAQAGVTEAEVGVQSTDPQVLKLIHRPLSLSNLIRGIEALIRHGIRPTLDFMYALPGQDPDDIQRSLDWFAHFGEKVYPQFLPTLLLPGTELRDRADELGLRAQRLPPYRILSTDKLSTRQLAQIEAWATERLGGFDSPTQRFVGVRLPDLFSARLKIRLSPHPVISDIPLAATANRQALMIAGTDLFSQRKKLAEIIRQSVLREPHILWQFVLEPTDEEPLDLLEHLIDVFKKMPDHWLDRLVSIPGTHQFSARRLFVKIPRGSQFDSSWIEEAEACLAEHFH